jgi:hypothetical protein
MTAELSTDTHRQTRTVLEANRVQDALDALSVSERRFVVQSTIGGLNPSAAAIDAGYKKALTSRKVNHAITVIRVELARDLDISFDDIKRGFMGAINMAEAIGEPGQMINGWKELAKLLGHYQEDMKPVIHIENMTYVDMQGLSDEELDDIIERGKAIEGNFKRMGQG